MKITVILKDKSDAFYNGNERIVGLLQMDDVKKFQRLNELVFEGRATSKVGNGSFRDKVELNQILRKPRTIHFKLEPRKGYKLATFDIN